MGPLIDETKFQVDKKRNKQGKNSKILKILKANKIKIIKTATKLYRLLNSYLKKKSLRLPFNQKNFTTTMKKRQLLSKTGIKKSERNVEVIKN